MTRVIRYKTQVKSHRGWLNLVALGDIHRARRDCNVEKLQQVYEWIRCHDCLVIGMGDYSEWITPKDRRFNFDEYRLDLITCDRQYRKIREEFTPFKDKIVALLDGNHDYNYYLENQHNYVDALVYDLGTEYGTYNAIIRLEVHREDQPRSYRLVDIYAHHGWTSARTMGGRVNRILDLHDHFPYMHIYLMGHVHLLGPIPPQIFLRVNKADQIVEHKERFFFTGSFTEAYRDEKANPFSGYAARQGHRPTSLGAQLIRIQPFRGQWDTLHIENTELPK